MFLLTLLRAYTGNIKRISINVIIVGFFNIVDFYLLIFSELIILKFKVAFSFESFILKLIF